MPKIEAVDLPIIEEQKPNITGVRAHHIVKRGDNLDFATNVRNLGKNLFISVEAAEKARKNKAETGFESGSIASKAYLKETRIVELQSGEVYTHSNGIVEIHGQSDGASH